MAESIDKWYCCEMEFTTSASMDNHIEEEHLKYIVDADSTSKTHKHKGVFKIECNQCKIKLKSYDDMVLHYICNHVTHQLQCYKCLNNYSTLTECFDHIKQCTTEQKDHNKHLKHRTSNLEPINENDEDQNTIEPKQEQCPNCDNQHNIENCYILLKYRAKERTSIIYSLKLCFTCLRKHSKGKCTTPQCEYCGGPHHVLLCYKIERDQRKKTQLE